MNENILNQLQGLIQNGMMSVNLFSSSLGIVAYILEALALYTIAKRRCIKKPWLAWIPLVNVWILGAVSDQYRYVTKGEVKNKHKWMLGLNILLAALEIVAVVGMIYAIVSKLIVIGPSDEEMVGSAIGALMELAGVAALVVLPLLAAVAVTKVLRWLCVYDVLRSCEPKNTNVYFWVSLGLAFAGISGLESVFMMVVMNKDQGMPPRKQGTPAPGNIPPVEKPRANQPEQNGPEF